MQRIYSIDFFKLFFAYIIAFGHFRVVLPPGSGVAVQSFYILSGFFLARKFYQKSFIDQGEEYSYCRYTLDHIRSLYPHYIFSLFMLALYYILIYGYDFIKDPSIEYIKNIAITIYNLLPEMLLVQNIGFFDGGINYPLWQLCALIISGYFIYAILCLNERKAITLVFPISIMMIQTLLKTDVDIWGSLYCFHLPLLRAFSPMCIGVLAFYFTRTKYYEWIKSKAIVFNLISIIFLLSIFVFEGFNNVFLLTFVVVIWALYDPSSWLNKIFNRSIFKSFGDFAYALYLNHALIICIFDKYVSLYVKNMIGSQLYEISIYGLFYFALTIYSAITVWVVNKLKKKYIR